MNFSTSFQSFNDTTWSPVTLPPSTTSNEILNKNYAVKDFAEVWLYFSPLLLLLGVVGNSLVVVVMRRKRLKKSSTSVYLVALAVADTAALLTRIPPEFFTAAGVGSFKSINEWTCRLEKFSFYTFSDIAIWILVTFTFDRFIAVCLPFYKRKVSLPNRAMHIIVCIVVVMVLKNVHVFWTRGREYREDGSLKKQCGRPAFVFEQYIRPWIAFTFITLLPFVIIVCCNVSITVYLVRTTRRMRAAKGAHKKSYKSVSSLVTHTSGSLHASTASATVQKRSTSAMTQTTLMCLSTSMLFLVCVSPSIILTLGRVRWINHPTSALPYAITRSINYQLSCLNHAINFFLYCLTGQRFRHELKQALKEASRRVKRCCGGEHRVSVKRLKSKSTSVRKFSFDSTSADTPSVETVAATGRKLEQVLEENEEETSKPCQASLAT